MKLELNRSGIAKIAIVSQFKGIFVILCLILPNLFPKIRVWGGVQETQPRLRLASANGLRIVNAAGKMFRSSKNYFQNIA